MINLVIAEFPAYMHCMSNFLDLKVPAILHTEYCGLLEMDYSGWKTEEEVQISHSDELCEYLLLLVFWHKSV